MTENVLKEYALAIESLPNLKERVDMLESSNESMGAVFNSVSGFITSKFTAISKIFTNNSSRLESIDKKDLSEQAKDLIKTKADISKIISNKKMVTLRNVEVPVPLGMNVDMLVASSYLKSASARISKSIFVYMDEVDTLVSKMLADPEYRKKLKPGKLFSEISADSSKNLYDISSVIDKEGIKDRMTLDNLLPNLNSLNPILTNLDNANKILTYGMIKKIKTSLDTLSAKIDELYVYYSENEELNITKAAISELAYGIENLADYTTSSITVFYLVNQLNSSFVNMIKLIK